MLVGSCPKQCTKIEGVVLNRVCILGIFCPKQGQGFKPSAADLYPNIGRVPPRESDDSKSTHNVWKKSNCLKSDKGLLCTSYLVYTGSFFKFIS